MYLMNVWDCVEILPPNYLWLSSNASAKMESENNRPAAQGTVTELYPAEC